MEDITKSRTAISYSVLRGRIVEKLKEAQKKLNEQGYESQHISPREFYDYLTGETPTGDTTTIVDVLNSEYLLIHEAVEMSELKKMSIPINKNTVMQFHPKVYEAHFIAAELEFDYAFAKRDYVWLKLRQNHTKSWLDDEYLPKHLVSRCKAMIKKLSEILSKES